MPEPRPASPLAPLSLPPLRRERLDNGLGVVVGERSRLPLVSVVLVFPAGSARDPAGKTGLSDFALELIRRGTARRNADAIDAALEAMGVDLRLETTLDSTYISATAPSEHLAPLLALISELVRQPAFPSFEVGQARKRTIARLANDLDDPATLAADALHRAALGAHPYSRPGRGFMREVARFTRADCVESFKRQCRPEGAWLAILGDAPADEALGLARRAFGGWKGATGAPAPLAEVADVEGTPILLVDKPGANQAQVRIASRGPPKLHPELIAARLSCQVLGGPFSARLNDAIRVTRGLSYGVSAYFTENEAGGLFVISSYTKTESVRELIEVALDETRRYREQGPGADELSRVARYVNGVYPLAVETVDQLARAIADVQRFGREPDWIERYRERVLQVDAARARELAREFFLPRGHALAVVGEAKPLAKQLAKLGRLRVVPAEALA